MKMADDHECGIVPVGSAEEKTANLAGAAGFRVFNDLFQHRLVNDDNRRPLVDAADGPGDLEVSQ